jgi:DNA repair protein RAD5
VDLLSRLEKTKQSGKAKVLDSALTIVANFNEVPPVVDECGVCMDTMNLPVMLPCFHFFCRECVFGAISANKAQGRDQKCPNCNRVTLLSAKKQVNLRVNAGLVLGEASDKQSLQAMINAVGEGSKAQAVLELLAEVWAQRMDTKFVIFSRFIPFIHVLAEHLGKKGIRHCVIDGATTLARRSSFISEFQNEASTLRVCLISSRAGNAGITLTAASHLVLCEPNLSKAQEDQAMGRIDRLGQTRDISIHRLHAKGTIEEKIFALGTAHMLLGQAAGQTFENIVAKILA